MVQDSVLSVRCISDFLDSAAAFRIKPFVNIYHKSSAELVNMQIGLSAVFRMAENVIESNKPVRYHSILVEGVLKSHQDNPHQKE